ncbi:MAG TPA: serine/threonine-protein kinase [Verrucomicrobiae bacterium]|nr:serine/threonine-protein kinase [Verrucomicrobiae bacterium]
MSHRRYPWRTGVITGIAAALAGVLALILPFAKVLTDLSYDLPFLFRSDQPVEGVSIIYMDVASEERLHQGRWEKWDRSLHARLLEILRKAGAKAVAFDIVFQRGDDPTGNAQLVAAVREFGKVVVAAVPGPVVHEGRIVGESLHQPFPELANAASWGVAEAAYDSRAIREHVRASSFEVPGMAWQLAALTGSRPAGQPFAHRWVNYYGPGRHIHNYSYADVLDPGFPATATFSNKVVFVGAHWVVGFTGGRGTDDYRTPHTLRVGRNMAGVEVCATTYLNLVRGDWLRRWPPVVETSVIGLCGLLAGFGLCLMKPIRALIAAVLLALVVPAAAMAITWQTYLWFPWLIVVAVEIPVALGLSALLQTRQLQHEKKTLEQTLALARAGSAPDAPSPSPSPVPGRFVEEQGSWSPVGVGSSARSSGPSAAVGDLVQASAARAASQPSIPEHELVKRIGRGAYGEVWLGRDIIGTFHAVKLVFRDEFKGPEPFEREFKGLSRFTPISRMHPGLVHVLQVGRNDRDGYLYYVMELADDRRTGQNIQPGTYSPLTLSALLHEKQRLPLSECLDIAIHLAGALEFLHRQNLIHRDIKPSNVIFVNGVTKFADIGLVTDVASDESDVTYLGTKGYIAPEGPGTPAADVYSLGKVIYQMGFGLDVSRFPELPTAVVMNPDEEALFSLNRVVMKACESTPVARFQSAAELQSALQSLRQRPDSKT